MRTNFFWSNIFTIKFDKSFTIFTFYYFIRNRSNFIFYFIKFSTNKSFSRKYSSSWICNSLSLSWSTNYNITIFMSNNTWSSSVSFSIWYYFCFSSFHKCNTRISSTQIDSNYFSHSLLVNI